MSTPKLTSLFFVNFIWCRNWSNRIVLLNLAFVWHRNHISFLWNRFRNHLFLCVPWEFIRLHVMLLWRRWIHTNEQTFFNVNDFKSIAFVFGWFVLIFIHIEIPWKKRLSISELKFKIFSSHIQIECKTIFLCVASMKSTPNFWREKRPSLTNERVR